jgi:hypothetical protein
MWQTGLLESGTVAAILMAEEIVLQLAQTLLPSRHVIVHVPTRGRAKIDLEVDIEDLDSRQQDQENTDVLKVGPEFQRTRHEEPSEGRSPGVAILRPSRVEEVDDSAKDLRDKRKTCQRISRDGRSDLSPNCAERSKQKLDHE